MPHSIAGFLTQLSRPSPEVRERLADGLWVDEALALLCLHEKPQLKQDGIRLLRALGKDCSLNQERFESLAASVTFKGGVDTPRHIEVA